jgi:predicted metal-dependent peptidase
MQLTPAEWCPTAATDGRNLYFDPEFVLKLDAKEVEFLLAHEVLHMIYDHIGRRGDTGCTGQ